MDVMGLNNTRLIVAKSLDFENALTIDLVGSGSVSLSLAQVKELQKTLEGFTNSQALNSKSIEIYSPEELKYDIKNSYITREIFDRVLHDLCQYRQVKLGDAILTTSEDPWLLDYLHKNHDLLWQHFLVDPAKDLKVPNGPIVTEEFLHTLFEAMDHCAKQGWGLTGHKIAYGVAILRYSRRDLAKLTQHQKDRLIDHLTSIVISGEYPKSEFRLVGDLLLSVEDIKTLMIDIVTAIKTRNRLTTEKLLEFDLRIQE